MKHRFDYLIIKIAGICKECEQYVESRVTISYAELESFRNNASYLREHKMELAYDDLDKHVCTPTYNANPLNKEGP
jgi:hypothetical protein